MHSAFFFLTADDSGLGRFDPAMLSDHMRVQILYTPDDYEQSRNEMKGDEDDSCTWSSITCDEDKVVSEIEWHRMHIKLCGSLCFQALPPNLIRFNIYKQPVRGDIDTSNLPRLLEFFCVERTQVTGTVDLGNLPSKLEMLFIMKNKITAIVNVVNLPVSLTDIAVNEKYVKEKSIYVGKLPASELILDILDCGIMDVTCADPADKRRIYTDELPKNEADSSFSLETDSSEDDSQ